MEYLDLGNYAFNGMSIGVTSHTIRYNLVAWASEKIPFRCIVIAVGDFDFGYSFFGLNIVFANYQLGELVIVVIVNCHLSDLIDE